LVGTEGFEPPTSSL